MASKICRLCGKLSTNNTHIFRTNGLKYKIETCLPIILYQPCVLPDTICTHCVDNVNLCYTFTNNCIQNLLILESQYEVAESCLKSKRKRDKGCTAALINKDVEELSELELGITKYKERCEDFQLMLDEAERLLDQSSHCKPQVQLVDYEDTQDELDLREVLCGSGEVVRSSKRKIGDILPHRTKMYKFCSNRRRKNTQPKKLVDVKKGQISCTQIGDLDILPVKLLQYSYGLADSDKQVDPEHDDLPPQEVIAAEVVCLLCDALFTGSDALAVHVLHTHGIDMATIISSEPVPETVQYQRQSQSPLSAESEEKIEEYPPQKMECLQEDLRIDVTPKHRNTVINGTQRKKTSIKQSIDHPSITTTNEKRTSPFGCPLCLAILPNRADLFTHLRLKHVDRAALICGLCISPNINTFSALHAHLEQCKGQYEIAERYYCKVCCYSDDNTKTMEIHIAVHDFLAAYCKEEKKLFDPEEYIEHNPHTSNADERFQCVDCPEINVFISLNDYVAHIRQAHEIFVCDLCNKSYGRSSHLWKHVHRLHKGHPTITCPVCEKTSASKYHLTQHFIKVHTKTVKNITCTDDFLSKKFAAFDFQSVRQSFMKQELMMEAICAQSLSKRPLLKKHTENSHQTRPQKDLLTRCKSCSRIFKDRQSLAKHLLNYHSEYTCEICAAVVISKCEIVSHIRFVHPNSKLFCQQCGEILRTQSQLREHLSDHENSNVCQFCGDLLDSKIKLKMHILSLHRKILSLSCGICLKLFENQHKLRDHVQTNHKMALNPLTSCTICGKNYGSKWKAYDHLNKSHGKMFHACKNCLAVFDKQSELAQHCELGLCSTLVTMKGKDQEQRTAIVNGNCGDSLDSNDNNRDIDEDKKSICNEAVDVNLIDGDVKAKLNLDEVGEISEESDQEVVDTKPEVLNDKSDTLKKKMCLLEKRLLGVRVGDDVENVVSMDRTEESYKADTLPSQLPPPIYTAGGKRTVYVDASAPARCDICAKTWPAKKHLWQHYIRCHRQEAATVCGICLHMNGGSYARLQRHLDVEHAELLYGRGYGSNFICRVCGRYHNARSKLRMHMAIHTGYVADKGKVSSVARNISIRDKPPDEDDYEEGIGNDSNAELNPDDNANKISPDAVKGNSDLLLLYGPQSVSNVHSEENLLNVNCKAGRIDDSSSSGNSTSDDNDDGDDDDDSDDDVFTARNDQVNPNGTNIPSVSTDSTNDSTTTIQITQFQYMCSTATSTDDGQSSNNNITAQVQLTNAVQSINKFELLRTLSNDNTVAGVSDADDVVITEGHTVLPPLDDAIDAVGQLSHELQSAVDSIL